MKRLRSKLTYANVMVTILAFAVIGGGTAFAATQILPKNSVGPKQLKKGAVTPLKLSAAAKATLTGSSGPRGPIGPQGVPGREGASGVPGAPGREGAAGPGAITFEEFVPNDGEFRRVYLTSGVEVTAFCGPSTSKLGFNPVPLGPTLDISGTRTVSGSIIPDDQTQSDGFAFGSGVTPSEVDYEVIVRNTAVGTAFTRFDVHIESPECVAWGMATPSTVG